MKRNWIVGIVVIIVLSLSILTGCGSSGDREATAGEIVKPVAVMELREEFRPITLHYTGLTEAKETKKYSFKTSGKIAQVFVAEGQKVKKGDKLALLEQEYLQFPLNAAKAQMEAAKAQYDKAVTGAQAEEIQLAELDLRKAQANYDFVKDYYEKIQILEETGAVSQQDLLEAALKMDLAGNSLEQAQKILELTKRGTRAEDVETLRQQYEIARANYDASVKMLEDSLLTADMDGYVLSVPVKENELAAAGHPVVVVCSSDLKGRIGLTQEDVAKINVGDAVEVFINNEVMQGAITGINKIPDQESRTYMTDLSINNDREINIGAIISVTIQAGMAKGIWVPVNYILNDGVDFVFVVENGRATRRNISFHIIQNGIVCVEGLKDGELLITEGFKSVKDGYGVWVAENYGDRERQ